MDKEPSSVPKNPRTHHRVEGGDRQRIVIAHLLAVGFQQEGKRGRGSVAQHTHKKRGGILGHSCLLFSKAG